MNSPKFPDAEVVLVFADGTASRTLSKSVRDLIQIAEKNAHASGSQTGEAVDAIVREVVAEAGVSVQPLQLHQVVRRLDRMRTTTRYERLEIPVSSSPRFQGPALSRNGAAGSVTTEPLPEGVFEPERRYPDDEALALYDRLAGIDEQKMALTNELALATNPARVAAWSERHHQHAQSTLLTAYRQRVPLVVLQGDVGTGKTALAESVGASLVRDGLCIEARLLKISPARCAGKV